MASPYVPISQAAPGTAVIAAPVAGQKIRLLSAFGFLSAAGTAQFKDDAGTALSGAMNVGTTGLMTLDYNPEGWLETASGKGLNLVSVTGNFNGGATIKYVPG